MSPEGAGRRGDADQRQIGQVQGVQCLRLAPKGGVVLLVTGTPETSSASMRRAGFLDRVRPPAYEVHELDGRWNLSAAEEALGRWFKVGAARRKQLDAVVCQNDAMVLGVRAALMRGSAPGGLSWQRSGHRRTGCPDDGSGGCATAACPPRSPPLTAVPPCTRFRLLSAERATPGAAGDPYPPLV
jgi:hypothetical protein